MTVIDSRDLGIIHGFHITAHTEPDEVTSPRDYPDLYSEGDEYITSWERDEWDYVGTVVTASRAGIELGHASIWGQEHGHYPGHKGWLCPLDGDGDNFANGYGPDLIMEAIVAAEEKRAELCYAAVEKLADAMKGLD